MNMKSLGRTAILEATEVSIDFELNNRNIENYRKVFDEPTVLTLMWTDEEGEDTGDCWVGGDMCDILYQIWEYIEDNNIKEYNLYYFHRWEIKNFKGDELDLLWAVASAYHSIPDQDIPKNFSALVSLEDDITFSMKKNTFDEEIDELEFYKLWKTV